MKFCENLSKISRFKSIYTCLNSTTRTRRDIDSNSIYFNKINSNKHNSKNIKFLDNNNKYSPKFNHYNLNKVIYFSNEKDNKKKIFNNDYNNSYYLNNSKSLYFNNQNLRGNYSSYCPKEKSNNNDNKRETDNNSHSNIIKDRRCISKIKLSSNKVNDHKFYCKNNSFKNNNSSIIKYSQNIVSKNNKIYIDKNKYKYISSNNISLPKKENNCKNINYASFYNNNIPFNKDSNKNNIFSERIHYKSYKTILKDENNNQKNYMNENNAFLDQQILDYLNNNYEEKNNLIKKIKNQKIDYYKKSLEKNLLNKNYTNDNNYKNNKTKIITFNNLNNYSYINNNYNYYCNNNYNSINNNFLSNSKNDDLLISKHYNSNMKSLYPNYAKNRIKKSVNKQCNMRISNYTNENINTNNIIGNKCLLNQKNEDINHPLNYTTKNIMKNKIFNSFIYDNNINSPKKYKIMKFQYKEISPSKIDKEDKIKNNCKKINLKGNFKTITGHHSMGKLNMNINKKKKKSNKNVIQKSLNLFFYNSTKNNKKNENIIPIDKTLNINISVPKSEKNEHMKEAKISLENSKRKMSYHKKCNSINGNINNKKIRKIAINNNIPKKLNEDKIKNRDEIEKNMKNEVEKGKDNESLISLQSINDSKILELANEYIIEEENFNKNEIIKILNIKKENNKG